MEIGTIYLKYLIAKFDNFYTAIASFNAGETIVRNWLKNKEYSNDGKTLFYIPYTETRNYLKKIKNNI
ncbi:MAG: transglycosylase SLT domain-containing protein, partial [Clostridia bacterium]|nr:transglycosylase SLT domain-containing protein [Clostridia bacterium]